MLYNLLHPFPRSMSMLSKTLLQSMGHNSENYTLVETTTWTSQPWQTIYLYVIFSQYQSYHHQILEISNELTLITHEINRQCQCIFEDSILDYDKGNRLIFLVEITRYEGILGYGSLLLLIDNKY